MDETPPPRTTPGARAEECWQPWSRKCEPVGRSFNAEGGEELLRLDAGSSSRSPYRQSLSLWRMVSTGYVNPGADPGAGVGAVVVVRGACLAVVCLEPMDPVRLTAVVARLLPVLKHLAGRRNLVSDASLRPDDRVIVTRTWMELVDALELLLCQPRPTGPRTAVFSTSPEASSAAMAALDDANLLPAEVTQHTEMRTRLVVPGATHTGWLVTVPPTSDIAQMALGMATLAEDPGVDAIVCVADAPTPEASRQIADMLDRLSAEHPEMTLVSAAALTPGQPDAGNRVPTVPGIDRAMRAVANVRIA
jgi:hypothetical protein